MSDERANLFGLTQDILAIDRMLEELDDPDSELTEQQKTAYSVELSKFLDDVAAARDGKVDGYCLYVRKLEHEKQSLEAFAREFSEKAARRKARIDSLKGRLVWHMEQVGQKKITTERHTVSWQQNGGVEPIDIVEPESVPVQFCKLVPSNTLIREAINRGEEVPGVVKMERGKHLRIK